MDIDGEDPGLEMEGEESMVTDPVVMATGVEATSVAMATENGGMLEEEGFSEMNLACDPTTKHVNETPNQNRQSHVPEPGVVVSYRAFSKMVLSPGFGYTVPKDGTLCSINLFILNLSSLSPEDVGCEAGENIVIMVGEGDSVIARQLHLCLQTMKQGEICDIEIPLNCGSSLADACPSCSFRIHLLSFQDSVSSWQLLPSEKITRAAHHKEKGTLLFQQGKTEFAFLRFSKALKYLVCCHPEDSIPDNLQETYFKLKCQCYSNMAACQMKLSRYKEVVENCSRALEIDPHNVKALYRRGQAYLFFGDIDLARSDLEVVASLEPQNKAVVQLLGQLEVRRRQEDTKMATGLSKMFS